MAQNCNIGGLDDEDNYYFKVYKVLVCEARIILYHIFNWGCPRDLTQSFQKHVKKKLKMRGDIFNKAFDRTMVAQMDKNPSGDKFDVSLLGACIRHTCPQFTKSMNKKIIKPIIDFRNSIIHNKEVKDEATMDTLIKQLRDMLVKAIKKAGEIYNKPDTEIDNIIKRMDDKILQIKQSPLAVTGVTCDITTYKQNIMDIRKANETLVEEKGVPSLKNSFKELSNVDPASWISGKERLNVKMVFTSLDIITKTKDVNSCYSVSHEELLELKTEDGKNPTVIVVEGDAGSGKSTLAKFILADWANLDPANPSPAIIGLEQYDLVLYVECKNRNISSFLDLLMTLIPQVSYDMTDRDLIRSVLAKRTLVVVDGLDEMNENSEMLLKEMLGNCVKMSEKKINFIITTRPQKMKNIPTLCGNNPLVHIRITGIPSERRVEFVEKLHDEMIKEEISKENTSHLVDYVKQSQSRLGEHYRLPLNLTLLTYLWANDPKIVNSVTSATSLYVAVLKLLKSRVISRIQDARGSTNDAQGSTDDAQGSTDDAQGSTDNVQGSTDDSQESTDNVQGSTDDAQGSIDELEDKVEEFFEILFDVYLKTHQSESMQLSDECQANLKTECKKLGLPFDDMCGAFFRVDSQMTCYGNKIYLSAPHKSIMEFFSAYKIFNYLTASDDSEMFAKEFEALTKKYKHLPLDKKAKKKLLQVKSKPEPKTVKGVLENLSSNKDDPDTIDFSHYQNVLLHLGGLMALKEKDALHMYGPEIIKLLCQSIITEAQWLDLVAEAECDPNFTSLVAENILSKLVVRDGHTGAAIQIFKDLDTNLPVQVILENEVKYIPKINDLMEELSERECLVELLLKNHWKNPHNGNSTELLKKLFQKKCNVMRFTGNLDDLKVLPPDVNNIRLTIASDEQAQQICEGIAKMKEQLDLEYLGIHVMKDVSPGVLKPLPVVKPTKKESGTIWLSSVEDSDVKWACDVAKALLPQNMKFNSIMFPRCHLSPSGFKNLLKELKERSIAVSKAMKTDSKSIGKMDVISLRNITKDAFNCEFHCVEESGVW